MFFHSNEVRWDPTCLGKEGEVYSLERVKLGEHQKQSVFQKQMERLNEFMKTE